MINSIPVTSCKGQRERENILDMRNIVKRRLGPKDPIEKNCTMESAYDRCGDEIFHNETWKPSHENVQCVFKK